MTGQDLYEQEALNWPQPTGWENLSKGAQTLWEERAKRISSRHRNDVLEQREPL